MTITAHRLMIRRIPEVTSLVDQYNMVNQCGSIAAFIEVYTQWILCNVVLCVFSPS
jgi:hypothetical protein